MFTELISESESEKPVDANVRSFVSNSGLVT